MFKRVNSDVVPFSINSPAGNRYAFGTTDVSNDIDVNYNENIKKGFGTGPNDFPELEDFNALMFTGSYLAAYLYQAGIPEWNDKQKYYINSIVMGSDGNLYKSLTGTEETPNVNNNPTLAGSTSWKSILSDYAKINGDETKKFKVATPEGDYDAVNKKYVDENVNLNINSFPEKTTPIDTDNLALQETGGLLKKVSFENLTKLSPNDQRVKTALNATGTAPIYACRAWVNFKGTGTVAIRASGNVSSITDNEVGDYTVNFTSAMPNANYSVSGTTLQDSFINGCVSPETFTTSNFKVYTSSYLSGYIIASTKADHLIISLSVHR
ncbi:hypothetical protein N5T79_06670 [Aliarcobacter cryaerophilus]|uniref:hypothetical protein n=1 Tax=Aliarcobacter cryaerophilus TaxID=28198 RepID=UPI0021B5AFD2|nr:hypothetical protein [Aliarcobacter cryaerophilus]MCT7528826.1 hypothetical protein [Aliarcobacter cryaerophilus]